MWRKVIPVLLLLSLLLAGCGSEKSYSADRYDVDIAVQSDGSLLVRETVAFRFVGGPFTYVFRDLRPGNTDGIQDIQATMDGATFPAGTEPGQVEIDHGDAVKVKWHFAPASDEAHTFGLTYRVPGVVRKAEGADLLSWGALPVKHDYPIRQSTVRVTWPEGTRPAGTLSLIAGRGVIKQDTQQAVIQAQDLGEDDELTLALRFPSDSLIEQAPAWQVRQAAALQVFPAYLVAALAFLVLGCVGWIAWLRSGRRPNHTGLLAGGPVTTPPEKRAPALAGALVAGGGRPGWPIALGTLFDLAQRGVVSIEQTGGQRWHSTAKNYTLCLLRRDAELAPHEQGLLELLFAGKKGELQESVTLDAASKHSAWHWKDFSKPLADDLRLLGLLNDERVRVRRRGTTVAYILLGLSIVGGVGLGIYAGITDYWPPVLLAATAFILSLVGLGVVSAYSTLTDTGAEEAASWRAFRDFLRQVAHGKETAVAASQFGEYLPYAAAFGLAEPWAKAMARTEPSEVPAWFHALAGANGDMAKAFAAMVVVHSAAGSSSGGAASGGAAGGGASGAG